MYKILKAPHLETNELYTSTLNITRFQIKAMIIDHSKLDEEWSRMVLPHYNLPATLRKHQKDAMTLLKSGNHVFLGKVTF